MAIKPTPNDMEIEEDHNTGIVEDNNEADRESTISIKGEKNKITMDLDRTNQTGFPEHAEVQHMDKKRLTEDNTDKHSSKNRDKKTEALLPNF